MTNALLTHQQSTRNQCAAGFTRSARQRHRHTLDMNLIKGEKKQ
ncbi:hypothetical protein [Phytobacter ursingii]|uniref:Uncharacterized protein n=1 Tax=Phytobacter ursingii TaxID=1972431 RepID=A0AB35RUC1_9ENTR|nr:MULTISPECIES: hypothetical protein [Enterobacteriaceae]MDV2864997.1 hypothetical protein [Phytobacter ursingii]